MTPADHANTVREALRCSVHGNDYDQWCVECAPKRDAAPSLDTLKAQAEKNGAKLSAAVDAQIAWETQRRQTAEAERDHLRKELRSAGDVAWALGEERDRMAAALRDVQKRIPVWGQGMTDTDWRDAHRVLEVVRAALAGTEQPYCTCPEGADGNPCAKCGKPEAVLARTEQP